MSTKASRACHLVLQQPMHRWKTLVGYSKRISTGRTTKVASIKIASSAKGIGALYRSMER